MDQLGAVHQPAGAGRRRRRLADSGPAAAGAGPRHTAGENGRAERRPPRAIPVLDVARYQPIPRRRAIGSGIRRRTAGLRLPLGVLNSRTRSAPSLAQRRRAAIHLAAVALSAIALSAVV